MKSNGNSGEGSHPGVFLGAETLTAGLGGIGRVARLMGRVIIELENAGLCQAHAATLSDRGPAPDLPIRTTAMGGARWRFVLSAHLAALTHSHFMYDSVSMARAHCRIPGLRRPMLTYIHGIEVWEGAPANRLYWARAADVLLTNTAATRDRAHAAHGGFDHARVCWLSTETDEPISHEPSSGPPTVLLVGRIESKSGKGHDLLLNCWPRVVAAVPGARLLFAGYGKPPDVAYWREQIARSPVGNHIEMLGFVPDDQMEALWRRATVFAMPSRIEGFGIANIEAMRQGLPVLATIHDSAREINVDGETGFNVNLDQPNELPDRLIRLLKDHDLARAMGQAGRARWQEHFCYSAFRKRFSAIALEFFNSPAK